LHAPDLGSKRALPASTLQFSQTRLTSILPVLAGDVRAALGFVPCPSPSSRAPKPVRDALSSTSLRSLGIIGSHSGFRLGNFVYPSPIHTRALRTRVTSTGYNEMPFIILGM